MRGRFSGLLWYFSIQNFAPSKNPTTFDRMITPTYSNQSAGITDWHKSVGRSIKTEGCLIFLAFDGRATVSVNMCKKTVFRKGDLLILTPDVYLSVSEVSPCFSARYVAMSENVLESAYYKITSVSLWEYLHYAPILRLSPAQQKLVSGWLEQTEWMLTNITEPERNVLLDNNIYNLFVAIDKELSKSVSRKTLARKDRAWEITVRLWSLMAKHALRERSVGFYANALHITPDYLNKVCRRAYGMSPKALIDQQLLVEIKSYLTDTQLSVAAIAERLHFEDASYMCRFFRRMTGCSPLKFRNRINEQRRSK